MTQAEALAKMKRQCKILPDIFTDEELNGFLDDRKSDAGYDLRRSIYDALGSALTVADQAFSRGGVSVTKYDLIKIRRQFGTAGAVSLNRG